ncbi:SLC13 family permease [Patulibacter americanus]|uniref:SLC13 family permease n=1 Tax=Patulibacter americanus TaxID=588672 RepID=UPI0003B65F64|nr:DASS family sodium-coupled anion symporter [Patulibacter americanus]
MGQGGTYATLDEQTESLSPKEERFERGRRTIGLFLGPALLLLFLVLPLGLEPEQQRLAAVFLFVITWWLTEAIPIPVTAFLGMALAIVLNAVPADAEDPAADVVFGAFASSTIFLFIGGFIIAQAMRVHGLDRRFAFAVLSLPGVAGSTYRTIIAFGVISALLSAFISNTAAAAMLFPIGMGIVGSLSKMVAEQADGDRDPNRLRFGTALMLMIAYAASIGGLLTPIGSPPNLIGREFIEQATDQRITFFDWVATAAPIVLVMFLILSVLLIALNRPEVRRIEGAEEYIAEQRAGLGSMSRGERNTLVAFGVAVTFWILPGIIGLVLGDDAKFYEQVLDRADEGVVALVAASLLFVLPVDWKARKFTLSWSEAVQIDWGTILLFGSGIALGGLLADTGLAEVVGSNLAETLGVSQLLTITLLATVVAVVISETTSNTASVSIVVPIVIPIAASAGVEPLIPALAAVFGSSYGFALPVSTPPNAIVYGSGMVPITKMVRSGLVFDVIGAVTIVAGVSLMAGVVGLV